MWFVLFFSDDPLIPGRFDHANTKLIVSPISGRTPNPFKLHVPEMWMRCAGLMDE